MLLQMKYNTHNIKYILFNRLGIAYVSLKQLTPTPVRQTHVSAMFVVLIESSSTVQCVEVLDPPGSFGTLLNIL